MGFGILAYPRLIKNDYNIIQNFRKENDELYYSVAEPHFAFVFPIFDIGRQQFTDEAFNKTKAIKSIDFEIKCATINKDAFLDYYHVLLVPDNGYSDIVKLHDKLYNGIFFSNLRLDIDFIPHIGIASSKDRYKVKNWVDHWNQTEFSFAGTIDTLTIVDYSNSILTNLDEIKLE